MNAPYRSSKPAAWFGLALLLGCANLFAACSVTEAKRKFEGADRTIITLENERIIVEIAPELEGRVISYKDKSKKLSPFEWLDDCPYHYGCRWEGKPFTYRVDSKGPDRAAVTVMGGGKVSVGNLHNIVGVDMATPLDLNIERTMSIDANSTRLRIDVKVLNSGESVAPLFRYMVHAVYGQVPHMPDNIGMYWFLPTKSDIEVFSRRRGTTEMWFASNGTSPANHPFNRWSPAGKRADKPRYEAGGWGAMLTSAGPAYIGYDEKDFDFMQFWYGGDAEWHFTFEPQTKPIDLKPGDTTAFGFTLAYDSKDLNFGSKTLAFERPQVPAEVTPGGTLQIKARATTVQDKPEQAGINIEIKDPQGQVLLAKSVEGTVTPFVFTDLSAECALPADCKLGKYVWSAKHADGHELASGQIEVLTPTEVEKRKTERAVSGIRTELEAKLKQAHAELEQMRKVERYWREGANLALTLRDKDIWMDSAAPIRAGTVGVRRAHTPVVGEWKNNEAVRIKSLKALPVAWPENIEKMVSTLGADQASARGIATDASGKGVVVLLADRQKNRAEIVRVGDAGIAKRFGRYAEKPGESDDSLGSGARALVVDRDGNTWVATNAWGGTSVFKLNQDKSPYEESIIGDKGAVKKFAPDGRLLGTVSLLETPSDLLLAEADGVPVVLAPYRNVSAYHGAMVREGVLVISVAETRRIGEIKIATGALSLDETGRLWSSDVAGHVACFAVSGKKLFDVSSSPAPAILDAKLPAGSPLPADVRADGKGGVYVLYSLKRKLALLSSEGKDNGEAKAIDATAGALQRLLLTPAGPFVLTDKGLLKVN